MQGLGEEWNAGELVEFAEFTCTTWQLQLEKTKVLWKPKNGDGVRGMNDPPVSPA